MDKEMLVTFIFLGSIIGYIMIVLLFYENKKLEEVRKNLYKKNGKVFSKKICNTVLNVMSYNLENPNDDDFFVKHYEDIKLLEKEKQLKTLVKDTCFGQVLLKKDKLIKEVEEKYKNAMAEKEKELKYAKALKEYKNKEKRKV